ncbi:hypothetical protein DDB_G0280893 [Dictyostelium discoideum AX4]|uniref:Ribokinase n=1 Tax=Dictyostelium discoideum TaxID=44689 RepID=RBSK_DICDI|nr:hypothetical protein DDB_G0280893 [Dictyostelium discoideum AX4]Q54UQ4.2 RecName: Full=Ribokinase; Short=RK [Dictyostelium discoideum]EAL66988.2 hypothetical protein DDB_G0280893 [Dictyostelium discoideum AX4]|eukprot:XP_640967.2 hypothetical protein DDB_G0280893 [Dictyostelium discoideum AX4]
MENNITVVGASNWDTFIYVDKMPRVGETIKGTDLKVSYGGKAANQAVQASLLGSNCTLITKLGDDPSGVNTLKNFKDKNINCEFVSVVSNVPSGCATIIVDKNGDNNIIIIGGSNDLLNEKDVDNAKSQIQNSSLLLCQLEVSLNVTLHALKIAKESNKCKTMLNLTPINNDPLILEMFKFVDILIVNEIELIGLYNSTFNNNNNNEKDFNINQLMEMCDNLIKKFENFENIIVTLGGNGQLLVSKENNKNCHIELKEKVKVVDTSGAGDSFIGSFAHYLVTENKPLKDSIESASKVASISVTRHGTQTSYPKSNEIN